MCSEWPGTCKAISMGFSRVGLNADSFKSRSACLARIARILVDLLGGFALGGLLRLARFLM